MSEKGGYISPSDLLDNYRSQFSDSEFASMQTQVDDFVNGRAANFEPVIEGDPVLADQIRMAANEERYKRESAGKKFKMPKNLFVGRTDEARNKHGK